jgi:leucyl aminopeptidase (aminopeptidase T)
MDFPVEYFHHMPAPTSFIEMAKGARKIVENCAGMKEGETVAIVTDTNKVRIAEVLAAAVFGAGGKPVIVCITPTGAHGVEPPKPVVAACRESDIYILATTWNLQHTSARIEAVKNGSRGTTIPQVTEDLLITGGILADFDECDRTGRKLGKILEHSHELRITAPGGTDIKGKVTGRRVIYETGIFRTPGSYAALPNSEINISPLEGTAEGVIVADVRMGAVGVTQDEPAKIEVREGKIQKIEGGPVSRKFRASLEEWKDPSVFQIAEFAIGLNPEARLCATFLEDEGRLGNGHVGIGSNWAMGGQIRAPLHTDLIFKDASFYFDGRLVMANGSLVL